MDRRSLLAAGLGLSGLAFSRTGSVARTAGPSGPPAGPSGAAVTREPGLPTWPLFEWEQPGGLLGPGRAVLRPPPLAVYGDDTAYADAAASRRLPPIWVSTLRGHALDVLGNPADTARGREPPSTDRSANWTADWPTDRSGDWPTDRSGDRTGDRRTDWTGDRPAARVRVRTDADDYLTVRLPDWADGDPGHAYPPQIRELYQHAMGIRRHVLATGRPWRPTGVLLAVVPLDRHRPGHCPPWPRALPVPDSRPYQEYRLPDGPHGLPYAGKPVWPCYRLPSNRAVAATWRNLLPHEIT